MTSGCLQGHRVYIFRFICLSWNKALNWNKQKSVAIRFCQCTGRWHSRGHHEAERVTVGVVSPNIVQSSGKGWNCAKTASVYPQRLAILRPLPNAVTGTQQVFTNCFMTKSLNENILWRAVLVKHQSSEEENIPATWEPQRTMEKVDSWSLGRKRSGTFPLVVSARPKSLGQESVGQGHRTHW